LGKVVDAVPWIWRLGEGGLVPPGGLVRRGLEGRAAGLLFGDQKRSGQAHQVSVEPVRVEHTDASSSLDGQHAELCGGCRGLAFLVGEQPAVVVVPGRGRGYPSEVDL